MKFQNLTGEKRGWKKGISVFLIFAFLLSMVTGCGKQEIYSEEKASETSAMKVGDMNVSLAEYVVESIQYFTVQGVDATSYTEKNLDTYKDGIIKQIRENKIIYNVAVHNNVKFQDKDYKTLDTIYQNFLNSYDHKLFDAYGITDDEIYQILYEEAVIAKFEKDMQNEVGKKLTASFTDAYQDVNYYHIYTMIFPTVKIKNGNPVKLDNGNYETASDAEVARAEASATSAKKELDSGADYKKVAEKYGVTKYSSDLSASEDQFTDEIKPRITNLQNGKSSDIDRQSLGFTLVYMIDRDYEEGKKVYVEDLVQDEYQQQYQSLYNLWLQTVAVSDKDLNDKVISGLDYEKLLQNVQKYAKAQSTTAATSTDASESDE